MSPPTAHASRALRGGDRPSVARRRDARDLGATLVELVLAIVLSSIIAGVLVAALSTSMNASNRTTASMASSVDESLITAFLGMDAQAAGGVDPTTASVDPTLGVSVSNTAEGWANCTQTGSLVVRFAWVDRGTSDRMTTTYALRADGSLVRRACEDGGSTGTEVVLGRRVTAATVTCQPAGCSGLPDSVAMSITGGDAAAPFELSLRASLRAEEQATVTTSNAAETPLVVLGSATCPTLSQSGTRSTHVLGDLVVDNSCGATPIGGDVSRYVVTGTTALLAEVPDPLSMMVAPAACTTGTNPTLGSSTGADTATVYPNAVTISGAVTFQAGRHVFCNGLTLAAGAVVSGSGVLLHTAGGAFTVQPGASLTATPATSGPYRGVLVWHAGTQTVDVTTGTSIMDVRGTVYAPRAMVDIASTNGIRIARLVAQRAMVSGGPTRFGTSSPTLTAAAGSLPTANVGTAYTATAPAVTGGTAPYTYLATGLPAGLSMSTTGEITGTPTSEGTATVSFLGIDATGASIVATRTLIVNGAPNAPANLAATPGDTTASITWGAPTGATPTSVTVTATAAGQATRTCTAAHPGLTCTLTGLVNGVTYTASAVATNTHGSSPAATVSFSARPAVLGGTDVRMWLDAADIDGDGVREGAAETGLVSNMVQTWADRSGRGNPAAAPSAGERPAATTQTMNGLPVITFNGNQMLGGTSASNPYGITGDRTMYVVTRRRSGTPSRLIDRRPADNPLFNITWDNTLEVRDDNVGQFQASIGSPRSTAGTTYVVSANRSASTLGVWVNGAPTGSSTITGTQTMRAVTIGRHGSTTATADLDVAEVLLFNRALTDAERREIDEYLARKWGADLPPVAPAAPTVTASGTTATATWSAPTWDGGSPVTGYTVTATPGGASCTTTTGTTCTLSGLTAGTTYQVRVAATNAIGTGPTSAPGTVTVVPAAPTGVRATPAINGVTASWGWPTGDVTGITGYTATASPGGATCAVSSTAPTSASIGQPTTRVETDNGGWFSRGHGSLGYVLPAWNTSSDLVSLPSGLTYTTNGARFLWGADTGADTRGVQDPAGGARRANTWYHSGTYTTTFTFANPASFTMRVYALDWDTNIRTQNVSFTVGGVTRTVALSGFNAGRWIDVPVSVTAGGTVTLTVTNTNANANAVIAAVLFDLPGCTIGGLTPGTEYSVTVTATNAGGTGPASTPATARAGRAWAPTDLGTPLALWLDAAEASTLTTSGTAVSQWRDRSGNNRHANQATGTSQPALTPNTMNGLPTVVFDGVNDSLAYPGSFVANSNYTVASAVARLNGNQIFYLCGTTSTTNSNLTVGWRGSTTLTHAHWGNDYDMTVPAYSSPTTELHVVRHSSTEGKTTWRLGTQLGTSANSTPVSAYPTGFIGSCVGTLFYNVRVGEIVMTSTALSTLDRQRLEGYLAHKWGTAGSLPIDHPHVGAPPIVVPQPPSAPNALTATAGAGQLSLGWTPPTVSIDSAVSDYVVQFRTSPSGTWTTFADGTSTTTSATVTGLVNGTAYDLRVAAVNGFGTGVWSTVVTATPVMFADVTAAAGVGNVNDGRAPALADFDGDGDLDIFVPNAQQANRLYRNNGNGTFTDIAASAAVNDTNASNIGAWGDYDNDGDVDLYVSNDSGQSNTLYRNNGNSTFTNVTATAGVAAAGTNSRGGAWGDIDGDGDLDLYVVNNGANALFRNNGNGTFTNITALAGVGDASDGISGSFADHDADGDLDLYVTNWTAAANVLYRNNGNGTFTDVTTTAGVRPAGNSRHGAWGDIDGDGDLDLHVSRYNAANVLYRNNGNGTFTDVTTSAGVTTAATNRTLAAAFGDIDIDGDLDLHLARDGWNIVFANDGTGTFTDVTTTAGVGRGGESYGGQWGDLDGDGDLDLYLGNRNVADVLFENRSTPPAAGTFQRVVVRRNGAIDAGLTIDLMHGATRVASRQIDGGTGWGAQYPNPLVFTGLSPAANYSVRYRCPDGATRTVSIGAPSTVTDVVDVSCLPAAPASVTAVSADSGVTVSWLPPANTVTSSITGYTATANPGGATCTASPTGPGVTSLGATVLRTDADRGAWITRGHGTLGYVLPGWNDASGDLASLPAGVTYTTTGQRGPWIAGTTTDLRGLQDPAGGARRVPVLYQTGTLTTTFTFANPASMTMRIYVVDWDATTRSQTMTITAGTSSRVVSVPASFNAGQWIDVPVTVAAGGTVTVSALQTGASNAVISGFMFDPRPTCTITGLTPGTAYSVSVTATNAVGTGPASLPVNATAGIAWTPSLLDIAPEWWLDASTGSTVTSSGGVVSSWTNRSTRGGTLTVPSGGVAPAVRTNSVNGLPTVRFTNDLLAGPDNFGGSSESFTAVGVMRENVRSTNQFWSFNGPVAAPFFFAHLPWSDGNLYFDPGDQVTNRSSIAFTSPVGSPGLVTLWKDQSISRNGVAANGGTAAQSSGWTSAPTTGGLRLGSSATDHDLAEIIAVDRRLSATDTQRLEGYLAHKWGLEGLLPSTHPFRNTAPVIIPSPPSAPGVSGVTAAFTSATLSLTAPAQNNGAVVTDYVVQWSTDGGGTWTTATDGVSASTTALVTGLTGNTAYTFRAAAVNVAGTGPWSATVNATTTRQFTDVTTTAALGQAGASWGAAWADYDGDGDVDVYVGNTGANVLYRNNGNGTFTDVTTTAGVGNAGDSRAVAWADYDADGDVDLYVANYGSANVLYRNNGNGTFTDVTTTAGVGHAGATRGVAWGDYDGDGDVDLYLGTYGAANVLYRNNGDGTFTDVTTTAGVGNTGTTVPVAWGDYDGDDDLDLYVGNYAQANVLYRNNGDGTFSDVTTTAGVGLNDDPRSFTWGDYDADGDLDMYVGNYGKANLLYRNNGNGTFTDVATAAGVAHTGLAVGVAWGDHDADGDLDMYVGNWAQANVLYRNNGDGTFTDVATTAGAAQVANTMSVAWADHDNDGDVDLHVTRYNGADLLLRNNTNPATGTTQSVIARTSGALASSTTIDLIDGATLVATRAFDGGSGYNAQNATPIIFTNLNPTTSYLLRYRCIDGSTPTIALGTPSATLRVVDLICPPGGPTGLVVTDSARLTWAAPTTDGGSPITDYLIEYKLASASTWTRLADGASTERRAQVAGLTVDTAYSFRVAAVNGAGTGPWSTTVNATMRTFANVSTWAGISFPVNMRAAAWGDYDGDGDQDMYLTAGSGGANRLYRNDGSLRFTDVTTAAGVGLTATSQHAAWGDYDNDTDLDLWVTSSTGVASVLYRNDGNGTFANVTASVGLGSLFGTNGAWGDYDNDGDLDLFFARSSATNAANALFRNNGGTFVSVTSTAGVIGLPDDRAGTWADYDGDGDPDLYIANNGANVLYRNNANGTFTNVTATAGVGDTGSGTGTAWGDYDNDGDLDLYVANNGGNTLYRNNANGTFTNTTAAAGLTGASAGRDGAWGDADGDGDLDLYVTRGAQANVLYRNNGDGTFADVTATAGVGDTAMGMGAAWGDYDGDGDLDLYVANYIDSSRLYRNEGNGTFVNVAATVGVAASERVRGAAWGDHDGDGDLDLLIAAETGSGRVLYRNNGNGTFTVATPTGLAGNSMTISWADADNDGDLDLLSGMSSTTQLFENRMADPAVGTWQAVFLRNGGALAASETIDLMAGPTRVATRTFDGSGGWAVQNATPVLFTNLSPTTDYAIRYRCDDGSLRTATIGLPSATADVVNVQCPPSEPTGLTAANTTLTWTAPARTGGAAITDFVVQYRTSPSGTWTTFADGASTTTTVSVTGLTFGTAYDYRVAAVNSIGTGTWSATVTATARQFTDVASVAGVADASNGRAGAWADFDLDGDLDLFVTNSSANTLLYRNNGNGTFTNIAAAAGVQRSGNGTTATWGDYDNDGDPDLYIVNDSQANVLYRNNGNSTFTDVTTTAGVGDTLAGKGAAWGDYDNDTDLDLYVTNWGANRLYRNNGNGTFTEVAATAGVTLSRQSQSPSWADIDLDGDLDLHVAVYAQSNALYRNNGNGTFTDITTTAGVGATGNSNSGAWGDFDNDGDVDLYVVNFAQANILYRNNGNSTFTNFTSSAGVADAGNGTSAAWGDHDNDGDLDLYVVNDGTNLLFRNDGNNTFSNVAVAVGVNDSGNGQSAAWADFDNDNDLDLYVVNANQANILYRNESVAPAAGTTQRVAFRTRTALGPGFTVDLMIGGLLAATRAIDGGGSLGTQSTAPILFTYLNPTGTYSIRYRCTTPWAGWPATVSIGTPSATTDVVDLVCPPGNPTGLTATAGNGRAFLSWTAGSSGTAAPTDYLVEFSTNGGTSWTRFNDGVSTATATTVSGLTNGVSHLFRVQATNSIASSSWITSGAVTPILTAPGAVTSVTVVPRIGALEVSWPAVASTETAPVDSYRVFLNGAQWPTTFGTTYTFPGLANNTSYTVTIAAQGPGGVGGSASGTGITRSPITAPTALTPVQTGGYTVGGVYYRTWNFPLSAPSSTGEDNVLGGFYEYNTGTGWFHFARSGLTFPTGATYAVPTGQTVTIRYRYCNGTATEPYLSYARTCGPESNAVSSF